MHDIFKLYFNNTRLCQDYNKTILRTECQEIVLAVELFILE